MKITKELLDRSVDVSNEIKSIVLETKVSCPGKEFEDYIFLALYTKIAELELKIEALTPKMEDFFPNYEKTNDTIDTDKPMD